MFAPEKAVLTKLINAVKPSFLYFKGLFLGSVVCLTVEAFCTDRNLTLISSDKLRRYTDTPVLNIRGNYHIFKKFLSIASKLNTACNAVPVGLGVLRGKMTAACLIADIAYSYRKLVYTCSDKLRQIIDMGCYKTVLYTKALAVNIHFGDPRSFKEKLYGFTLTLIEVNAP